MLITTPGKILIKLNKKDYFNSHIMAIHTHERCLLLLFFIKCLLHLYSCVNNTWIQPGLWRSVTSSLKKWSGSYKGPWSCSILLPNKNICLAEWSYQVIHFLTKKARIWGGKIMKSIIAAFWCLQVGDVELQNLAHLKLLSMCIVWVCSEHKLSHLLLWIIWQAFLPLPPQNRQFSIVNLSSENSILIVHPSLI